MCSPSIDQSCVSLLDVIARDTCDERQLEKLPHDHVCPLSCLFVAQRVIPYPICELSYAIIKHRSDFICNGQSVEYEQLV